MVKTVIEMPKVSQCEGAGCVYNSQKHCHAKAITVGDFQSPECDTYGPARSLAANLTMTTNAVEMKSNSAIKMGWFVA